MGIGDMWQRVVDQVAGYNRSEAARRDRESDKVIDEARKTREEGNQIALEAIATLGRRQQGPLNPMHIP